MLESEKRSVASAGTPQSGHGTSVSKDLPSKAPVPGPNWRLTIGGDVCDRSHGLIDFANGVVEVEAQAAACGRVQAERVVGERGAVAAGPRFHPGPVESLGHAESATPGDRCPAHRWPGRTAPAGMAASHGDHAGSLRFHAPTSSGHMSWPPG